MTDSHKEMCACEHCMGGKKITKAYKYWQTITRKRLQKEFYCEKDPEEKAKKEETWKTYLAQAFKLDGETHRFNELKDLVAMITCPNVGDFDVPKMQCALGYCKDCPKYQVPDYEKQNGPDAKKIKFGFYLPYAR